jgi:hypothetical protein
MRSDFSSKLLLFQKFEEVETSRRDDSMATKTTKLSAEVPRSSQKNSALIQALALGLIQRRVRFKRIKLGCPSRKRTLKLRRLSPEVQ